MRASLYQAIWLKTPERLNPTKVVTGFLDESVWNLRVPDPLSIVQGKVDIARDPVGNVSIAVCTIDVNQADNVKPTLK